MAQTRRRRQTKHRGNAAGAIESRGRTGRRPAPSEKQGGSRKPGTARANRFDRPPTWRGAFYRAMAAAVVMLLISLFAFRKPNQAIAIFPIVLIMYIPVSYYTDLWLYRRRERAKASGSGGSKAGSKV